jgi:T5SS/PEP-CTERM-associated repeat protein
MTEKITFYSAKGSAGDLADPLNWAGDVVPNSTGTGVIDFTPTATFDGSLDINNLMLLGSFTLTFAGSLETVGVGNCQGLMVCEDATMVFAPTATLNDGNAFIVGNEGVGTFISEGSGSTQSVVKDNNVQVGRQAGSAGNVTIDDSIWTTTSFSFIGEFGVGSVSVIDDSSALFHGNLFMGAHVGAIGSLAIASGGSVDVIGSLVIGGSSDTQFGIGEISVASGSTLTVGHQLVVGSGDSISMSGGTALAGVTAQALKIDPGGIITGYGTIGDSAGIQDNGTICASGGTLTIDGNISGTGNILIEAGSFLQLNGTSTIKPSSIDFVGSGSTLALSRGVDLSSKIIGFAAGDIIAMASIDGASFSASSGLLKLSEHGSTLSTLHLVGSYSGDIFGVTQTTAGAQITLSHS